MALTVMDVAKELNVSKQVVYREIKDGKLAAFRVGRQQLRVDEAELAAYKNRNTIERMIVL